MADVLSVWPFTLKGATVRRTEGVGVCTQGLKQHYRWSTPQAPTRDTTSTSLLLAAYWKSC